MPTKRVLPSKRADSFAWAVHGEDCYCISGLRRYPNGPKVNHSTTYFDSIEVGRTVSAGINVYKYTSEDKSGTKRRFDIIGTGGVRSPGRNVLVIDNFYCGGFSIDQKDSGFVLE